MLAERPAWDRKTVVCIASGPSLTIDDCEAVRTSGFPVVVTNTTFRLCPWADGLMAHDGKWWAVHAEEVDAVFRGHGYTVAQIAERYGARLLFGAPWFRSFANSGASAVSLAICAGARRVVLLGFDCCHGPAGEVHWHGDHPKGLGNAASMPKWSRQFDMVARFAADRGVEVVNASRRTALTQFPVLALEDAL